MQLHWILFFILIGLIVTFTVLLMICHSKVKNYEGFCGFNHGDKDPHQNDHIT